MERIKGRPATGHPTLFLLDEFAGLKRLEVIENATAQAAGFGVKFFFVVQSLVQLKEVYKDSWEVFLGNSGLQLFFQVADDFTRSYLSRMLGEREVRRQSHSGSQSSSASDSITDGWSTSVGDNLSTSRPAFSLFRRTFTTGSSESRSNSGSRSRSGSTSATDGWSEAVHKRALLNPDEIGRLLARVDDRSHPAYPGVLLALVQGEHPLFARRVNYFESRRFTGYFDPHPDFSPPLALGALEEQAAAKRLPPRSRRQVRWFLLQRALVPSLRRKYARSTAPEFRWLNMRVRWLSVRMTCRNIAVAALDACIAAARPFVTTKLTGPPNTKESFIQPKTCDGPQQ